MRSYQIVEWGKSIEPRDYPTPTPTGTEVLLRVTAAGICHSDLHINDGFFDLGEGRQVRLADLGVALPMTPGHEIAGVVEAVGPDAQGVAVGDRRVVFPWIGCRNCSVCRYEREQLCLTPRFLGARANGGYSDLVLVPEPKYLIDYEGVPAELACTYTCAGLTAYSALRKVVPLSTDDDLVLIGAGGVGLSGLHIAPAVVDARLLVADIDPAKRAAARQAGAYGTIDNGSTDAAQKVIKMTRGGARAAIDFVGAPDTARFGFNILRKGGTLVIVGLYGGSMALPLPSLPQKSLTLRGSYVGTLQEQKEVMALARSGRVPPIPLDLRPLSEASRAMDDLRAGRVNGRIVLQPGT